ncbi:MAG: triphosphoribosyl-dephospho-CoA synthase, partial [Oscillospiraceae bacterium]|nr:triphosphoribosyl-dephospho-CoA synthase [Oscillospiraceae bacterium]MBS6166884.1 triphosphoribosyl-dephospho-CoA synthase [Bacillota bacterium]
PLPALEAVEALDREMIRRNLSPGGCADLLAVTYFLHFLSQNSAM